MQYRSQTAKSKISHPHKDDFARMVVFHFQKIWIKRSFARTLPWQDSDPHWIAQVELVKEPLSIGLLHSSEQLLPESLRLLQMAKR